MFSKHRPATPFVMLKRWLGPIFVRRKRPVAHGAEFVVDLLVVAVLVVPVVGQESVPKDPAWATTLCTLVERLSVVDSKQAWGTPWISMDRFRRLAIPGLLNTHASMLPLGR